MTKYQITCNEDQLRQISNACELVSRLHMHQFDAIASMLWPNDLNRSSEFRDRLDDLKEFFGLFRNQYHGIYSKETSDVARTLWDVHQVLRHRLSYDAHPGITPENRWKNHCLGVNFDEPMQSDEENELIEVRKIESI